MRSAVGIPARQRLGSTRTANCSRRSTVFPSLVREGWQDLLRCAARRTGRLWRRDVARSRRIVAARAPTGPVVIEHANLFDAEHMTMRPGSTVILQQQRIVAVVPGLPASRRRRRTHRCRGPRPAAVPLGHAHVIWTSTGPLFPAAGVTGIRDMAAETDKPGDRTSSTPTRRFGPRVAYAGIIGRAPSLWADPDARQQRGWEGSPGRSAQRCRLWSAIQSMTRRYTRVGG